MVQRLDFSAARVLVVGDVMLDKYIFGGVSRISPEAPVPVVKVNRETKALGGAGNVVHNCARLGAKAHIIAITGRDHDASLINGMLDENGIAASFINTDAPTTAKLRVIAERQQVVRLDFEECHPLAKETETALKAAVDEQLPESDVIVLSDYGKGVCSTAISGHVIAEARKRNIPVIVDPKGSAWEKYRGASIVTPNVKELAEVAGRDLENTDDVIVKHAGVVRDTFGIERLLVTRSARGMSLVGHGEALHIPTEAREVFDVSGAGDTVVAALACGLAVGETMDAAARIANRAAGIVVAKIGTAPVELSELVDSFRDDTGGNVLSIDPLMQALGVHRSRGKKVVFTNGCFDILHRGHLTYLRKTAELGDILVVGLNSDASVRKLKGEGRPVNNQDDRALMLASLEFVDYVIIFEEDTPQNLIRRIKPDVLVKGGDYRPEDVVGREDAGETVIIDFVNGYSTTKLITQIQGGDSE